MPSITVNGVSLHYQEKGAGERTLLFSHGLLFSGDMFKAQIDALSEKYRCIAFDFRGQGQSEVTSSGYDMDTLTEDTLALIKELGLGKVHFVGLSMGGFIGLRIGIRHPHLLRSLTILDSSAEPEPAENKPKYRSLNFVARWFGLRLVMSQVMPILFGKTFMEAPDRAADRTFWKEKLKRNHHLGITRAVRGVVDRESVLEQIHRITVPTLIMVGNEDTATVPAKSERMASKIKGSSLIIIPAAGHSSTIENPEFVTRHLREFIGTLEQSTVS